MLLLFFLFQNFRENPTLSAGKSLRKYIWSLHMHLYTYTYVYIYICMRVQVYTGRYVFQLHSINKKRTILIFWLVKKLRPLRRVQTPCGTTQSNFFRWNFSVKKIYPEMCTTYKIVVVLFFNQQLQFLHTNFRKKKQNKTGWDEMTFRKGLQNSDSIACYSDDDDEWQQKLFITRTNNSNKKVSKLQKKNAM